MGLMGSLFDLFDLIYQEGEKEWLAEGQWKEALNELNIQLEGGEITEEAFEQGEEEILAHLKEIRDYKKEHGYYET